MNSLIIVESKNDKFFIEALIKYLNFKSGVEVQTICEFECLDGITNLENKLKDIKIDNYEIIGIILDANSEGIDERIKFINDSLKSICSDVQLNKMNKFKESKSIGVKFICYIMNLSGKGELETILRKIKKKDSTYADCLSSWRDCVNKSLNNNKENIKDKDFNKFWVNNYIRYDTCSKKEKKQAEKNCTLEKSFEKDIWDFDNKVLDDLKNFLKLIFK